MGRWESGGGGGHGCRRREPECGSDHVLPQRHLLELETKRWARAAQRGLN